MRYIICTVIVAAVFISAGTDSAASQNQEKAGATVKREIIPGSELMTPTEREQYRQRMRGARTLEEQAKVREEHKEQMQVRARQRGLRLAEPSSQDVKK